MRSIMAFFEGKVRFFLTDGRQGFGYRLSSTWWRGSPELRCQSAALTHSKKQNTKKNKQHKKKKKKTKSKLNPTPKPKSHPLPKKNKKDNFFLMNNNNNK
jgi:hypothetical protein